MFIAKGREDALVTRNLVPGDAVYGEKRISVDVEILLFFSYRFYYILFLTLQDENGTVEYRVWNPFRSKLAAAIMGGLDHIFMKPGSKVLYLGAASGTTVSHVSDLVGPVSFLFLFAFYFFA